MLSLGVRSWCVVFLSIFAFSFLLFQQRSAPHTSAAQLQPKLHETTVDNLGHDVVTAWKQKTSTRLVALVFYGRREFVSILDCYLQRNLVRNGGLLDEVIFVIRTDKTRDLIWLGEHVDSVPEYSKTYAAKGRNGDYTDAWDVVQNGTTYIKIDDDVVFFEDHTIAAIVKRKIEHPEYFLVSANLINQPAMAWVHYHLNAYRPYFPELTPPEGFTPRVDGHYDQSDTYQSQITPTWRASELPVWSGAADYTLKDSMPAPFVGHRWLPAPGVDIDDTPVSGVTYDPHSAAWSSWEVGAQSHYSFFENLEKNELWRYKYDLWDYHYDRLSINFVCISGDDLRSVMPMPLLEGDEVYLTQNMTRLLRRHAVMDGTGLASHFGFGVQVTAHDWHGIHDTDVLDRYRAYAEERVCGKPRGSMTMEIV